MTIKTLLSPEGLTMAASSARWMTFQRVKQSVGTIVGKSAVKRAENEIVVNGVDRRAPSPL